MPLPARRVVFAVAAATLATATLVTVQAAPADAGPSAGLCQMDTSRGVVPDTFTVDACVDGRNIVLSNDLDIPLEMTITGASGAPVRPLIQAENDLAAIMVRQADPDPMLLLPGDLVRIPIGSAAASVELTESDEDGSFAVAKSLAAAASVKDIKVSLYEDLADFYKDVSEAYIAYSGCLQGKAWYEQLGCREQLDEQIAIAKVTNAAKALFAVLPETDVISKLLDTATYDQYLADRSESQATLAQTQHTLTQTAVTAPAIAQHLFLVECARVNPCSELLLVRTDANGGNPRTVGGSVGDPLIAVSPDGTEVALAKRSSDGTLRLYVRSVATGSDRLLASSDCGQAYLPSWSPDGRTVAYLSLGATTCSKDGVYTVSVAGGTPTRVLPSSDNPPSWDPSGNRWAVTTAVNPETLYIMDTNGTGKTAVYKSTTGAGFNAIWSPDGSTIGVTDGHEVIGLSPDGGRLWSSRPANFVSQYPFAWALDSKSIFYAGRSTARAYQVDPTTGKTLSVITASRDVVFVAVSR